VIGAKRVTAPDGTAWRVGRRWLPEKPTLWRPKRRHADDGGWFPDIGLGDVDDAIAIVIAVIGVILLFILLTTVVFPIIVFGIELLIVALLLVGGIAARLLFRRPWTIRARAGDGRELTWRAVGFRRSGRVRDDAAAALALGHAQIQPSESLPATP
jgi:hypothetical protein